MKGLAPPSLAVPVPVRTGTDTMRKGVSPRGACPLARSIFVGLIMCAAASLSHAEDSNQDRDAARLVAERCGICHSTDLVTQQRLDRSRWTATVDKMIHWGAPLSQEERNALVNYLATQYHQQAPVEVKPNDGK